MRFIMDRHEMDRTIHFSGSFSYEELASLNLNRLDRLVLEEEPSSPADCLLSLEIIFRRHAEQKAMETSPLPEPPTASDQDQSAD